MFWAVVIFAAWAFFSVFPFFAGTGCRPSESCLRSSLNWTPTVTSGITGPRSLSKRFRRTSDCFEETARLGASLLGYPLLCAAALQTRRPLRASAEASALVHCSIYALKLAGSRNPFGVKIGQVYMLERGRQESLVDADRWMQDEKFACTYTLRAKGDTCA